MSEKNYLRIAERMALRAIGTTYPNPPVGAVIVNNGIILSRGWTQPKGVPHAEIHAINQIKNKKDIKGAHLYCTLEPCSHEGKTPPCVDKIIELKFAKVIISQVDKNPLVNNNSVKKLRSAGIKVIIKNFGDLEGSILKTDLDIPRPLEKEVLIRVKAAGVNRPDILQRQGLYKVPNDASPIMGLEVSGEITEVGTAVTKKKIGDRVCALVPGGGYAEYVVTNEAHCLPVPKGLSMEAAAGLCECLFTVWINMVKLGQLKENDIFLVHGGSSGIGMFAIQLAKQLGATVLTTAPIFPPPGIIDINLADFKATIALPIAGINHIMVLINPATNPPNPVPNSNTAAVRAGHQSFTNLIKVCILP